MTYEESQGIHSLTIDALSTKGDEKLRDVVAVEEPLEIRLSFTNKEREKETRPLSITMRTPGEDRELAAGFLFTEGIIEHPDALKSLEHVDDITPAKRTPNVMEVELSKTVEVDFSRLERHFYTSSSCGVCGKTSIQSLRTQSPYVLKESFQPSKDPLYHREIFRGLHSQLENHQGLFSQTGGIHAAGLFTPEGELIEVYEDVGRHNALDKLVGSALLKRELPLKNLILMVSGRASFELLQKASMAGATTLAAVGAPSSLAVQLADEFGMTLIGFLKSHRFNVYTGGWRIANETSPK